MVLFATEGPGLGTGSDNRAGCPIVGYWAVCVQPGAVWKVRWSKAPARLAVAFMRPGCKL